MRCGSIGPLGRSNEAAARPGEFPPANGDAISAKSYTTSSKGRNVVSVDSIALSSASTMAMRTMSTVSTTTGGGLAMLIHSPPRSAAFIYRQCLHPLELTLTEAAEGVRGFAQHALVADQRPTRHISRDGHSTLPGLRRQAGKLASAEDAVRPPARAVEPRRGRGPQLRSHLSATPRPDQSDRPSSDRPELLLRDQRQELRRSTARPVLVALPPAHQIRCHVEVVFFQNSTKLRSNPCFRSRLLSSSQASRRSFTSACSPFGNL